MTEPRVVLLGSSFVFTWAAFLFAYFGDRMLAVECAICAVILLVAWRLVPFVARWAFEAFARRIFGVAPHDDGVLRSFRRWRRTKRRDRKIDVHR